jgi:hypothetical protein
MESKTMAYTAEESIAKFGEYKGEIKHCKTCNGPMHWADWPGFELICCFTCHPPVKDLSVDKT